MIISKIPQSYLDLINQIFEIEKKVAKLKEENSINRNLLRMKEILEYGLLSSNNSEVGLTYHNPIGENYNETRTDCDASIAGETTDNLKIIDVIKPIVYLKAKESESNTNYKPIVQKGVVIVESQTNLNNIEVE